MIQAFLDGTGAAVTCADVIERNHPEYSVPTCGAVVGDDLVYVAASQLDRGRS